ncbi:WD40 repeat [Asanoa hainanensis]|uniref:WD40 repeat n=1 Tax=Asanoa hainanensis TaxID=560556 RepID=A0A239N5A5_9ACTN|nr:WD40 repeat domain-containing protein [Asanoa hainanensis]SNT50121.1 WD40 repeat [Asanoa hainanensis]
MAARRRATGAFDYLAFVLGAGVGLFTNLATARADRWPGWLQPLSTYSAVLGGLLVFGVTASWWWQRRGPLRPAPRWTDLGGNPYPGLTPYTRDREAVFAGRGQEIRDLTDRVLSADAPGLRFVPIVGPSGSGKSSLVLAGLLPRLDRRWKVLPDFAPQGDALAQLESIVGGVDLADVAKRVAVEPSLAADSPLMRPLLRRLSDLRRPADRLLIVVDQLEELVSLQTREELDRFMGLMSRLVDLDRRLHVVATLRSEYIGAFQQGAGSELFTAPFMVNAMTVRQLRQVVTEPADETDTTFEDGLVEDLLTEVGAGDALPLLSYFLSDLYDRRGPDQHITRADYEAAGTVGGIITRRAETAVANSGHPLRRCLEVLAGFVSYAGPEPTRHSVRAADLDDAGAQVVQAFLAQRLITSDSRDGEVVFALGHEALLRRWPDLRDHIEAHAEQLRKATELAALAAAWDAAGKDPEYLIDGRRLDDTTRSIQLTALLPPAREYLSAAVEHAAAGRERRANVIARQALATIAIDQPRALAMARAAYTELKPTPLAAYALQAALPATEIPIWDDLDAVLSVAFVSDLRIATGSRNTVRIWDANGRLLHRFAGRSVSAIAVAPDGSLATGSFDKTVRIWDSEGRLLDTLTGHADEVHAVAFAPDGRLATGSVDHTVKIWHRDRSPQYTFGGQAGPVRSVAFAPDGRLASGSADCTVWIWGLHGELLRVLADHTDEVSSVAFAPDGRLAAGSADGTVRVWDLDGEPLHTLSGHADDVGSVAFAPDGRLATGSDDHTVKLWDRDGRLLDTISGHQGAVTSVAFASDGRLATGSYDHTLRIWAPDGRELRVFTGHPPAEGEVATRTRRPPRAGQIAVIKSSSFVVAVAFAADGRLAISDRDTVRIWDVDGSLLHTLTGQSATVRSMAFAPGGRLATGSANRTVEIWGLDGRLVRRITGHRGVISSVAFAPDGRLATGSEDRTVKVWDVDGRPVRTITSHGEAISSVAFAPDGRLATGSVDHAVKIWEPDGRLLRTIAAHPPADGRRRLFAGFSVAFAPDGCLATASHDGKVEIWNRDGSLAHTLAGHDEIVTGVAFASDGRVATCSDESTVKIWHRDGQLLHTIAGPELDVTSLAFASDGRLATGSNDARTRIHFWPVDGSALADLASAQDVTLTPRQRAELGLPAEAPRAHHIPADTVVNSELRRRRAPAP